MEFATWFGKTDSPLFGVVHAPSGGSARGAVVICQPIGNEQLNTYRGVKQLAEKLCESGLLVLRFDYAGLGDSGGDQAAPDAVRRWCDSIVEAVDYVRAAGATEVALIGLRLGALLAAATAERCGDLCALLLWDPVVSGRSYLREERALYQLSIDETEAPPPDRVPLLGVMLHESAAADIAGLALDQCPALTLHHTYVLVAVRPDAREGPRLRRAIQHLQADALLLGYDQSDFVAPPSFVLSVPSASIALLAARIQSVFPDDTFPVRPLIRNAITRIGPQGGRMVESLRYHGDQRLFAIHVTPACPRGPVAIFHGTASQHRTGPTRLWVELARELADRGVASVRFDRRGIGDSGAVALDESTPSYAVTDRADARDIVRALGVPASQLVLVGLCSGAWHAAATAREIGARGAVLISLVEWSIRRHVKLRLDPLDMFETGTAPGGGLLYRLRARVKSLQHLLPYPLWFQLGKWKLVKVPEVLLDALWRRGVKTSVVLTPNDYRWFSLQRGDEGLERLRERGYRDPVTVCERGDHALYGSGVRDFMRWQVLNAVIAAVSLSADFESTAASAFPEVGEAGANIVFH